MSDKLKTILGNVVKFAIEMINLIEMLKTEIRAVKIKSVYCIIIVVNMVRFIIKRSKLVRLSKSKLKC